MEGATAGTGEHFTVTLVIRWIYAIRSRVVPPVECSWNGAVMLRERYTVTVTHAGRR
jgi:hypothetical protein